MKTSIYLLSLIVVASPSPGTTSWQGTTGDWSDSGNWTSNEPTNGQDAQINNGGTAEITQSGEVCNGLIVGTSSGQSGFVNMSGGSLTVTTNPCMSVTREREHSPRAAGLTRAPITCISAISPAAREAMN